MNVIGSHVSWAVDLIHYPICKHMPNGGGPIDLKKWIEKHPKISPEDYRFLLGHALSHLRVPLIGIKGYLNLLEQGTFKDDESQIHSELAATTQGVIDSLNDIIELKLAFERQSSGRKSANQNPSRSQKRVLHFEDDNFLSKMYAQKFTSAGFDYRRYENPSKDPVSIIVKEKPDLILMNVIMPEMDGFTATEQIKADSRTKDIPLIFLTNLGQPEDTEKGMALGADKYLVTGQNTPDMVIDGVRVALGLRA